MSVSSRICRALLIGAVGALSAGSAAAFTCPHHGRAASIASVAPAIAAGRASPVPFVPRNTGGYESSSSQPSTMGSALRMADGSTEKSGLPMLLDPGTRGGALFLSLVLFVVPILGYEVATGVFGVDPIDAGRYIGVGFTLFTLVLWVSTYIFRVATKDMTYAKQLKDYENAVIAKRLEELDDDEVQALVEDIERDDF